MIHPNISNLSTQPQLLELWRQLIPAKLEVGIRNTGWTKEEIISTLNLAILQFHKITHQNSNIEKMFSHIVDLNIKLLCRYKDLQTFETLHAYCLALLSPLTIAMEANTSSKQQPSNTKYKTVKTFIPLYYITCEKLLDLLKNRLLPSKKHVTKIHSLLKNILNPIVLTNPSTSQNKAFEVFRQFCEYSPSEDINMKVEHLRLASSTFLIGSRSGFYLTNKTSSTNILIHLVSSMYDLIAKEDITETQNEALVNNAFQMLKQGLNKEFLTPIDFKKSILQYLYSCKTKKPELIKNHYQNVFNILILANDKKFFVNDMAFFYKYHLYLALEFPSENHFSKKQQRPVIRSLIDELCEQVTEVALSRALLILKENNRVLTHSDIHQFTDKIVTKLHEIQKNTTRR